MQNLFQKRLQNFKLIKSYRKCRIKKRNILEKSSFSLTPYYELHLFDPDRPLYYDIGARITTSTLIKPGLLLRRINIHYQPLMTLGPKGNLPKVRTNLRNYLNVDTRITELTLSSYFKLNKDLFGRLSMGTLSQCMQVFHLNCFF